MLEHCFVRPETIERIASSWLGPAIARYGTWLGECGYRVKTLEQPTRLQILKGGSPFSVNYLYRTDSISGACGGNKARYART
jgi:hypothetical protein